MLDGKTEKLLLGPKNLLISPPKEMLLLREETLFKLKFSTITTLLKRIKKNLKCTELKPSNSNIFLKNKPNGVIPNKKLMIQPPPTGNTYFTHFS